jgi:hypothetical protein
LFFVFAFCWCASCFLRNVLRTKFFSFQLHLFGFYKQHTTFFGPKVILAFVFFHQYRLSNVLSILSTNLGHWVKPRSTTQFSIFFWQNLMRNGGYKIFEWPSRYWLIFQINWGPSLWKHTQNIGK